MSFWVLTGSNRGLGLATAKELVSRGVNLIVTMRDPTDFDSVVADIRTHAAPGVEIRPYRLELGSFASVRTFATELEAGGALLDGLINNAGMLFARPSQTMSEDHLELTLQVNAVAPCLLTLLLLPRFDPGRRGRVVNVGSSLHFPGSRGQEVDFSFQDPFLNEGYNPDRAYKNSKLALIWWTYAMARRAKSQSIDALIMNPGFIPVNAAPALTGFARWFMKAVMPLMPFTTSLKHGARMLADVCLSPDYEGAGTDYIDNGASIASSEESYDEAKSERFWHQIIEWTQCEPDASRVLQETTST